MCRFSFGQCLAQTGAGDKGGHGQKTKGVLRPYKGTAAVMDAKWKMSMYLSLTRFHTEERKGGRGVGSREEGREGEGGGGKGMVFRFLRFSF